MVSIVKACRFYESALDYLLPPAKRLKIKQKSAFTVVNPDETCHGDHQPTSSGIFQNKTEVSSQVEQQESSGSHLVQVKAKKSPAKDLKKPPGLIYQNPFD